MLVACPKCKTRYRVDDERVGPEGIKLRCSRCPTVFRVVRRPAAEAPSPAPLPAGAGIETKTPSQSLPASPPPQVPAPAPSATGGNIRVLIAHESAAFCGAVTGVLAGEPFDVRVCNDGEAAYQGIREFNPHVALLDVALPKMFGFEVCDAVKNDPATAGVKILLIAAIYDKTRYKRTPASLYSADDYIEKHHIPDQLVAKIYRLASGQEAVTEPPAGPEVSAPDVQVTPQKETESERRECESARQELRQAESADTTASPVAPLPEGHVKARRLARIIVSDIALYNQQKVEEGVRNGTFFSLLENDVREGRDLYTQRVPAEVRAETNFLEEAFNDLIEKIRKELHL